MHFPRVFLAVSVAALLFGTLQPKISRAQSACPTGQREHKDDRGVTWCVDSEGRSYKAERQDGGSPGQLNEGSTNHIPGQTSRAESQSPRSMRLCISAGCHNLIWRGEHYDGMSDAGDLVAEYKVVKWDSDSITLTGAMLKPDSGGNIAKGVFTGKVSPDGESAEGGDAWEAGRFKGLFAFKLTWGSAFARISNVVGQAAINQAMMPKNNDYSPATEVTPSMKPPSFKVSFPERTGGQGLAASDYYTLGGTWEFESVSGTANYRGEQITIYQFRGQIIATKIKGPGPQIPGQDWFGASFTSPHTLEGHIHTWDDRNPEGMIWQPLNMTAEDADHITLGASLKFRRVTTSELPKEAPCDVNNPMRISADDAWGRHWYYDSRGDVADSACWIYIAAIQGNLRAEGQYALMLSRGVVIQKDLPQAYAWAQRAAIGGDVAAEGILSDIFNDGIVVPKDHDRSKYWSQRYDAKDIERRYDLYLKAPAWMFKTSGPCDPANPNHEDAGDAYWKGQVAYEAALHHTAHCWLTISANQGFAMAYVTLSKQYLAGEGVSKDPEKAFSYMKKAAEMGDLYGQGYLAEFYRTGTGNPGDMRQAIFWRDKLTATNQGEDVWEDIRHIREKSLELLGIYVKVGAEEQRKIDACLAIRQRDHLSEGLSASRKYCGSF